MQTPTLPIHHSNILRAEMIEFDDETGPIYWWSLKDAFDYLEEFGLSKSAAWSRLSSCIGGGAIKAVVRRYRPTDEYSVSDVLPAIPDFSFWSRAKLVDGEPPRVCFATEPWEDNWSPYSQIRLRDDKWEVFIDEFGIYKIWLPDLSKWNEETFGFRVLSEIKAKREQESALSKIKTSTDPESRPSKTTIRIVIRQIYEEHKSDPPNIPRAEQLSALIGTQEPGSKTPYSRGIT